MRIMDKILLRESAGIIRDVDVLLREGMVSDGRVRLDIVVYVYRDGVVDIDDDRDDYYVRLVRDCSLYDGMAFSAFIKLFGRTGMGGDSGDAGRDWLSLRKEWDNLVVDHYEVVYSDVGKCLIFYKKV